MKLESQVCSLELAKRLKELGVDQESLWYWNEYSDLNCVLVSPADKLGENFAAFTVAELGEMLKGQEFDVIFGKEKVILVRGHLEEYSAETEADARAKMLINLIENKLVTL